RDAGLSKPSPVIRIGRPTHHIVRRIVDRHRGLQIGQRWVPTLSVSVVEDLVGTPGERSWVIAAIDDERARPHHITSERADLLNVVGHSGRAKSVRARGAMILVSGLILRVGTRLQRCGRGHLRDQTRVRKRRRNVPSAYAQSVNDHQSGHSVESGIGDKVRERPKLPHDLTGKTIDRAKRILASQTHAGKDQLVASLDDLRSTRPDMRALSHVSVPPRGVSAANSAASSGQLAYSTLSPNIAPPRGSICATSAASSGQAS